MNRNETDGPVLSSLVRELGVEKISASRADRFFYARDQRPQSLLRLQEGNPVSVSPMAVVWPTSVQDVIVLMKWATHNGVTLVPYGGGTTIRREADENVRGDGENPVIVDMKRLSGVEWIRPDDNLVRVKAGLLGAHLEEQLNSRGLTVGHFARLSKRSSVGGWLAQGSRGSGSWKDGDASEVVVSVQVVLPSGDLVETNPFPGSGVGPDLTRFFLGSGGKMGVVTAATLKVRKSPQKSFWRAYSFKSMDMGQASIMKIVRQGVTPSFFGLYDERDSMILRLLSGPLSAADVSAKTADLGRELLDVLNVKTFRSWFDRKALRLVAGRPAVFSKIVDGMLGGFIGKGCVLVIGVDGNTEIAGAEFQRCNRDIEGGGGADLGEELGRQFGNVHFSFPFRESELFSGGAFVEKIRVVVKWEKVSGLHGAVKGVVGSRALVFAMIGRPVSEGCTIEFTLVGSSRGSPSNVPLYRDLMRDITGTVRRRGGFIDRPPVVDGNQHKLILEADANELSFLRLVRQAVGISRTERAGEAVGAGELPKIALEGDAVSNNGECPDEDVIHRLLEDIVGAGRVSRRGADIVSYQHDGWARRLYNSPFKPKKADAPMWIVWPEAAAEVAHVVRLAARHGIQVVPYGGGSSLVGGAGGPFKRATIIVDMKRMSQVLHLDEDSSFVHVQAGIMGGDLEAFLAHRGLRLGHLPSSFHFSTVGGWLAVRSVGEWSARFGGINDMCLGVTAVSPSGEILNAGSAPIKPSGRDLQSLLTGSEGRLGIITSANLRVVRPFESRDWFAGVFKTSAGALKAWAKALSEGARPLVARVLGVEETRRCAGLDGFCFIAGFGGPAPVVAAERSVVNNLVVQEGGEVIQPEVSRRWWRSRVEKFYEVLRVRATEGAVIDEIDVSAPWSRLSLVGEGMRNVLEKMGAKVELEWSSFGLEGGCVICRFFITPDKEGGFTLTQPGGSSRSMHGLSSGYVYDEMWRRALDACRSYGGGDIHHRGVGRIDRVGHQPPTGTGEKEGEGEGEGEGAAVDGGGRWRLFKKLTQTCDPDGVFSDVPGDGDRERLHPGLTGENQCGKDGERDDG